MAVQDGPVSVTYGDVYKKGELKIEPYDLTTLPPLPAGYVSLNNRAYMITTTAMVSGPHVIRFSAASVSEEAAFRDLRIFHAEPDTFDPDSPMWVDRTSNLSEASAANQSNKIVLATSDELGVFVIGKLLQKIPPSAAAAELAVTCSGSPNPVISPKNVTFTVKLSNNGPQSANEVGVINSLSPDSILISAAPSQGTCKEMTGSLYCKLGTLAAGAAATIQIIVKPDEGTSSFPQEGKLLVNHAWAAAREADINKENNTSLEYVRVFPDPNLPPTITLDTPKMSDLFVGPAEIIVKATATDPEGAISKVEFFDNGYSIGMGTSTDGKHFLLTERNVSFGKHSLWAVATDDGGRENSSGGATMITVNGSANVSVTSPLDRSSINPLSNLTLAARASHPSGVISKVEFFVNDQLLGEGTLSQSDKYTFSWQEIRRSVYSITAVATDGSGITTTSAPITIAVSKPSAVRIINPSEGTSFLSQSNLSIRVKATQPEGSIKKVDFYANGTLIGSASDITTDQFLLTWRNVQEGVYSLTAVATDELGVKSKSPPVKIAIENQKGNRRQ